jgi:uncharacterized protein YebE (UPF0316 family)
MNQILRAIEVFVSGTTIWVYLFIFFGKILEVSLGTLRIVLINRGVRSIGAVIAFFEIMIWLILASSVLIGFKEDFLKGVVYALAFACGNYIGSWLDELLAFGLSSVQVVLPDMETAKEAEGFLREKGFGVTAVDAHGRDSDRGMLIMTMQRKRLQEAIAILESQCNGAVVTVSDIKTQRGGYLERLRHSHIRGPQVRFGQLRKGK